VANTFLTLDTAALDNLVTIFFLAKLQLCIISSKERENKFPRKSNYFWKMIKIAMKSRPFLEKNDDIVDKLSIE
jgi:hypothetical protein